MDHQMRFALTEIQESPSVAIDYNLLSNAIVSYSVSVDTSSSVTGLVWPFKV